MELFKHLETQGHEQVLVCSNPEVGLKAIIAVHSTTLGPALGGARMWPFATFEEAMTDVLRLSRGMTYKAAVSGLNLGGGKAVIIGDAKKQKSEALFRAFGRFIDSLGGLYITAEDVGVDMDDMEHVLTETKWVTGVSPAHGGSGDPGPVTAYGVLQGIKAASAWQFGTDDLSGRSVAVQGLGAVGFALAKLLLDDGARVLGSDIDPDSISKAADAGVEIVDNNLIASTECDIYAPCALGAILNQESIPKLACQVVAGSANNQLHNAERDGRAIHEAGILYAPDYVINAGGLINVYNELTGKYNQETALRMTRGINRNLTRVFEISKQEQIPTYVAADRVAEERIQQVSGLGAKHWGRTIKR